MKKHMMMTAPLLALALAASACVGEADPGAADEGEDVASTDQELVSTSTTTTTTTTSTTMSSTMIAPVGPITWNGTIGTWPIAIWSSAPLDFIAFDVGTLANLSLTAGTMDKAGAFTPLPGVTPLLITPSCMSRITTGLETSPLWATSSLLSARSFSPLGFGMAFPPGPSITSNALMLTGLPTLGLTTPLVVDVRFDAAKAASMAGLSIFAAQVQAQTAATSTAFASRTFGAGLMGSTITSMVLPIALPATPPPSTTAGGSSSALIQ